MLQQESFRMRSESHVSSSFRGARCRVCGSLEGRDQHESDDCDGGIPDGSIGEGSEAGEDGMRLEEAIQVEAGHGLQLVSSDRGREGVMRSRWGELERRSGDLLPRRESASWKESSLGACFCPMSTNSSVRVGADELRIPRRLIMRLSLSRCTVCKSSRSSRNRTAQIIAGSLCRLPLSRSVSLYTRRSGLLLNSLRVLAPPAPRPEARAKMRYRLPLELELCILELAAPPLDIDSLPRRVDFFIKISLAHRSLTAWAQDRLRDQFLYTYRPRKDEHERLKKRLEAGFGRERPLRRLYLDLTRLPDAAHVRTLLDTTSDVAVDRRVLGASLPLTALSSPIQNGATAHKAALDEVAHFVLIENAAPGDGYWELCAMITDYSQALDRLRPPLMMLDLKDLPRAWEIDPVARTL